MTTATALKPNNPAQAKAYFQDKLQFTTGPVELDRMLTEKQELVVIDVRDAEDYEQGHVPGAINLPKEKWTTLQGLNKNKQNILYCYSQVCHLAAKAAAQFAEAGYPVMELEGGWKTYQEHQLKIETGKGR
jgi:rhodanese-related sulfurtransferase